MMSLFFLIQSKAYSVGLMHASVDGVSVLVVTCKCDVVMSLRSAGHVGDVMRLFLLLRDFLPCSPPPPVWGGGGWRG